MTFVAHCALIFRVFTLFVYAMRAQGIIARLMRLFFTGSWYV